jgi:hypothetical protein
MPADPVPEITFDFRTSTVYGRLSRRRLELQPLLSTNCSRPRRQHNEALPGYST